VTGFQNGNMPGKFYWPRKRKVWMIKTA